MQTIQEAAALQRAEDWYNTTPKNEILAWASSVNLDIGQESKMLNEDWAEQVMEKRAEMEAAAHQSQIKAALQKAIDEYKGDTGPVFWDVDECNVGGRSGICLVAEVEDAEENMEGWSGDEPWKKYGGDAILAAAKMRGVDGMSDNNGRDTYFDIVLVESI